MIKNHILIDKPKNWTSHDVVAKIRNILNIKKVGHTGTLDPFATGLLIILTAEATKKSEEYQNYDKEYIVTSQFGLKTTTGDITGEIIDNIQQPPIDRTQFEAKIQDILKITKQIPSNFSAIKVNGKRAYQLARSGKQFELPERYINIKEFELISFNYPYFTWRVFVSKGTYIRTLTEQIAELFGSIATTIEIRRTKIGNFDIKDAKTLSDFIVEKQDFSSLKTGCVVTVGTFDGVHLGHQHLLSETVKLAQKLNTKSVVITYYQHPNEILEKEASQYLLTEFNKREKLIRNTGVDFIHYINFDKQFSQMSADDFIKKVLVEKFNISHLVIGYDTHFGVNKSGTLDIIKQQAQTLGFTITTVAAISDRHQCTDDIPPSVQCPTQISSSKIRDLLKNGNIPDATKLLGYNYSITGKVITNKKIGRTLGFPTINLQPLEKNKVIPKNGVYKTEVRIKNKFYKSITNIGVSPTIKTENIIEIETFVLDFSENVYDKIIELFFIDRIRDEMKFDNTDALIEQINKDIILY